VSEGRASSISSVGCDQGFSRLLIHSMTNHRDSGARPDGLLEMPMAIYPPPIPHPPAHSSPHNKHNANLQGCFDNSGLLALRLLLEAFQLKSDPAEHTRTGACESIVRQADGRCSGA